MKQIDYKTAVELMAFAGSTDVRIMVDMDEAVGHVDLYKLESAGKVAFFLPDDPPKEADSSQVSVLDPPPVRQRASGARLTAGK